jgi:hypothetical protein
MNDDAGRAPMLIVPHPSLIVPNAFVVPHNLIAHHSSLIVP